MNTLDHDLQHVNQLAREVGCTLHFDADGPTSWFEPATLDVHLHPYDGSEGWYWTALHELGHAGDYVARTFHDVFAHKALGLITPHLLEDEARAWLWAIGKSRRPMSAEALSLLGSKFGSYALELAGKPGPKALELARFMLKRDEEVKK